MKDEITTEELAAQAKKASKRAIERAKALGVPYTVQEGKKIITKHPDGSEEVIKTLPRAYCVPPKKKLTIG